MKKTVKRILLVMSVAALMAAMLVVTAVPAFATIHDIANMERAVLETPGTTEEGTEQTPLLVQKQDPPGVSDGPAQAPAEQGNESQNSGTLNAEGPNPSVTCSTTTVSGSCGGNFAQPVIKANDNADADTNPGEKEEAAAG